MAVFALTILVLPEPAPAHKHTVTIPKAKYDRMVREKRGSYRRIVVLNQRNRVLRKAANQRGMLARSIVPWISLRHCETNGIPDGEAWTYNGRSGFKGALQFHPGTWRAYGGATFAPSAHQATPVQQVAIAQKVLKRQGRSAWPSCSKRGAW